MLLERLGGGPSNLMRESTGWHIDTISTGVQAPLGRMPACVFIVEIRPPPKDNSPSLELLAICRALPDGPTEE